MSIPNRIDYIVGHQAQAVEALNEAWPLDKEPGKNLTSQTKARVRQHGRPYIEALLQLHPDKAAVLAAAGHDAAYDGFCGCGSTTANFNGVDAGEKLKELVGIIRDEYQDSELLKKLRSYTDAASAEKSVTVQEREPGNKNRPSPSLTIPTSWLWLGGMLFAGFVLGRLCTGGAP